MADTDKLVYLPQLQRYDEKLKRWANDEFLAKADAAATDVRINGTTITVGGVADIPISDGTNIGVIMTDNSNGGYSTGLISENNRLFLKNAPLIDITERSFRIPILANNMDYAVKAAMCDGQGAAWTPSEQAAARERMGIGDYSIPKATATTLGGVKVGNGLNVTDDGTLSVETHSSETLITTSITATYDNTGTWNAVCKDTYDVIVSWFDNYDRVFAFVNSGANSLRPFPRVFVELLKVQEGLIVSTPFTIQYVVPSNNPRVRTGMTTTALCQIYFNANGSINFQMSYSEVDQYADAAEFTNTVNEGVSMLALKDGGITSAKLANSAVTAAKLASKSVTTEKIADSAIRSVKIALNAVTEGKIADGAITAQKIKDGAIQVAKIKDGAVTSAKLALGAVTAEKIKDGAIITEKLSSDVASQVNNGNNSWTQWSAAPVNIVRDVTAECRAYAWGKVVTITCYGVSVSGNERKQIGALGTQYAPAIDVMGSIVITSSKAIQVGVLTVDTDGDVYISMGPGSSESGVAAGSLTYLTA